MRLTGPIALTQRRRLFRFSSHFRGESFCNRLQGKPIHGLRIQGGVSWAQRVGKTNVALLPNR